jgi:poly-gamma-glutamate capsule biosynthesis protein CapA/YwtB (metallophosphatase superfamily)
MKFSLSLLLILLLLIPSALADDVTLTLSFAGDCTLGSQEYLRNQNDAFDSYIKKYGTEYPFEKVRDLFLKDDWTVVNLECVLSDSAAGENTKQTYRFRGPSSFTDILASGGVDMVNLANNHTDDYGKSGLQSTKDILMQAGIPYCHNEDVYILEKKGIRIAFLGICVTDYDTLGKFINEKVAALKSEENCQFVIVNFHYGWEYSFVHNKKQKLTSHELIASGADLVVGTHPHVVQGIENYKNRLILYSVGNFSFGGNAKLNDRSLQAYIAQVTLTFSDGKFKSQQLNIIPVHTTATQPKSNFQPFFVTGELAQAVVDRIQGDTPFPLKPYTEGVGAMQDPIYAQSQP